MRKSLDKKKEKIK